MFEGLTVATQQWLLFVLAVSVLTLSIAATYAALKQLAATAQPIWLVTVMFTALAGCVAFWATFAYNSAWMIYLAGIIVYCAIRRRELWPISKLGVRFLYWSCIPLILGSIALPIIQTLPSQTYEQQDQELSSIQDKLVTATATHLQVTRTIASDPEVAAVLKQSPDGALSLESRRLRDMLRWIVVTDGFGRVQADTDPTIPAGTPLISLLPWMEPALRGQNVSGIAYDVSGTPVMVAAVPLQQPEILTAIVITAKTLDQSFLRSLEPKLLRSSLGLASRTSVITSDGRNQTLNRLFENLPSSALALENASHRLALHAPDGTTYILTRTFLPTLLTQQPLALLQVNQKLAIPWFRILIWTTPFIILISIAASHPGWWKQLMFWRKKEDYAQ